MAIRLGDILVEKKLITKEQLEAALKEHEKTGEFLGQVLIRMGFIDEVELAKTLSRQMGLPYVNLQEIKIDDSVIRRVPAKFAWHYKIMPVKLEGNVLTVAVSNPFDMWPLDNIETNLGFRTERVLSSPGDIMQAIKRYYGVGAETIDGILARAPDISRDISFRENAEDIEKMAEDASVIKLVNQVL